MKSKIIYFLGMFIILLCCSWGFYAHKLINQSAVFTLPTQLAQFYKKHVQTITEKAVDADRRCYIDTLESPRHFIDIDDYEEESIDSIPIHWSKAVAKYEERRLRAQGIVPWQIYRSYQNLVTAFADGDVTRIVRYSADLGHYIADAHVPLHTTKNYNGQFSEQIGIHAFWESRLPEMFAGKYNLFVGKAEYIEDPLQLAWDIIKESNALVDNVLQIEKELSNSFPKHQQKSYINRKNVLVLTYSDDYAKAYHDKMEGMVEARMRKSIQRIGSYWFSAWVDAGQPKLNMKYRPLETEDIPDIQNKRIIGREEWH
ncbi:zinc dependent phospholipase C family protein [Sphingobacterium wenxiniae]|uniref:S1/P1 Nuclease n=1 Tax=Sphingobacterium wenxiniae TaxID=683125 RepID=A0A1I6Q7D8_9SPHI|nr:zinc dependent phospholipase C family protein [Sphingobacterium wenxiniae]SFS48245.1 hypothetical protein SAMN05660206_102160 [Sphingobacterium wenxiniae]